MSYTQLFYHIVFRPLNSLPVITLEHEEVLYKYIWGFVQNKKGTLFRIGGISDHLHLLVRLPPTLAISNCMHDLKIATHNFMREHKKEFPYFESWGKSYCAITCSSESIPKIIDYIKNQKEHHRRISFRDELLNLLQENGITVNMEYFLKE